MAIVTSYPTLLTAVGDYLARSDLSTFTPNFVQNFEERFFRDSENWGSWMESALSVTITNNVAAVPASYLGLRVAYIAGNYAQPLKRVTLEQLYSRYPRGRGTSGTACFMARNGANFEFGPENVSGTLTGTMFAKPTVLRSYTTGGADAVAHFLIVNAPDLLLYGALLEAEPFIQRDERLSVWKSAYDWALDTYRSRMMDENSSGSTPFTVVM
jgi:hypothetical protein